MAALVTNLTQVLALDANSMTSAAVGGATAAMPVVASSFQKGIDGSVVDAPNAQMLENEATALTAGVHYSAWQSFGGSTYDISGVDQAMVVHFKNNSPSYTTIETNSDSIYLIAFSGGGTTNYGRWLIDPTNIIGGTFYPLIMTGTPDATGGTFDDTAVTAYGFAPESSETGGAFGFQITIDQLVYINGPAVFEDTGAAATVTLLDYYNLLKRDSGTTYHSLLYKVAGFLMECGTPIDFQCDDYDDSTIAAGIAFKPSDDKQWPVMASGYYQARWTPPASSTQLFQNFTAATTSTDFNTVIDASAASCDLTFEASLFAGINDVVIGGAGLTMTATLASPATCDIADGNLSIVIDSPDTAVDWTAGLVAGSNLTINTPVGDALTISFAETDLSDIAISIPGSAEVNLTPTTGVGTYVLTGLTSAGTITFDNDTANNTTASVSSSLTAVQKGTTTGGGLVAISVPATPATASITNILAGSRLRIVNNTKATQPYNDIPGTSFTDNYTEGTTYSSGDNITIYIAQTSTVTAQKEFSQTVIATSTGWSVLAAQESDDAYDEIGLDGSTFTGKFSADYVDDEVDLTIASDFSGAEFYAWWTYNTTTSQGISDFFGGITALDQANFRINSSVVSIFLDNLTATNLKQTDNRRIYRADGAYPVKNPTTGGGGIDVVWRNQILIAETGVSGLTAAESTQLFSASLETSVLAIPTAAENRAEMDSNSIELAIIVDDTANSIPAQIAALTDFNPSADILENGKTYDELWRVDHSALAGKSSKIGSTETFRDDADTKDRITATTDTNGQRLTVSTDGT